MCKRYKSIRTRHVKCFSTATLRAWGVRGKENTSTGNKFQVLTALHRKEEPNHEVQSRA